LREFSLEVPTRRIAIVRKQRMDAFGGLLGLQRVDTVFSLVAFLIDGQDAKRGDGFKRVAGLRMQHTHAKGDKVAAVSEDSRGRECC
jgi:hypothetical protein